MIPGHVMKKDQVHRLTRVLWHIGYQKFAAECNQVVRDWLVGAGCVPVKGTL